MKYKLNLWINKIITFVHYTLKNMKFKRNILIEIQNDGIKIQSLLALILLHRHVCQRKRESEWGGKREKERWEYVWERLQGMSTEGFTEREAGMIMKSNGRERGNRCQWERDREQEVEVWGERERERCTHWEREKVRGKAEHVSPMLGRLTKDKWEQ